MIVPWLRKRRRMRRVGDAMLAPVATVEPSTMLQEASARMLDAGMHAAVVVDAGRVCGMVTAERLSGALGEGHDPTETPVAVIAERDVLLVDADDALADAHARMRAQDRTQVPVVTGDGKAVGLLVDSA